MDLIKQIKVKIDEHRETKDTLPEHILLHPSKEVQLYNELAQLGVLDKRRKTLKPYGIPVVWSEALKWDGIICV